MAEAGYWMTANKLNLINSCSSTTYNNKTETTPLVKLPCSAAAFTRNRAAACVKGDDFQLITSRSRSIQQKPRRHLVKISTASSDKRKWGDGKWTCDYSFSLQQLQLEDLADQDNLRDSQVSITLCVHKHASFGLSVEGRIMTCFTTKCINCCSPYCRKIDTEFNVWILPSSRRRRHNNNKTNNNQLPEIGGDDPSVIYVKPGHEADLDSLIQDTIRLATMVKETCSESCEKAQPTCLQETCSESCEKAQPMWQYVGQHKPPVDGRWASLLKLRNAS